MRRRNPLLDPVTDLLDQLTYPNSAPRGPTLPAYLAQTQARPGLPMLSGRPSQFAPSQAGPMVRQPAAPDEFMTPPAQHTGIPAGLAQVSQAMMADQTPEDEPMHGFAPPDSDPSLSNGVGPLAEGFYHYNDASLPSGPALHARIMDARIRGDRGDSEVNAGGFRRVQQIRRLQQQAMNAPMLQDGARPSPIDPNAMRNMLAALVQSSQAYAGEHGGTFMGMRPWARQPQRRPGQ